MEVKFRKALLEDTHYFSHALRDADRLEASAVSMLTVYELIADSISKSEEAHIAYTDEGPFALFGISYLTALGGGCPWFIATPSIEKHKKFFVKKSKAVIDLWLDTYGRLWNVVHEENVDSIKYLKALGFEFGESREGVDGHRVIEFYRELPVCVS